MGSSCSVSASDYVIFVATGDKKSAGTDADVKIILHGENNQSTHEIKLDRFLRNDFERGQQNKFKVPGDCVNSLSGKVCRIELWRDNDGASSSWFVDTIVVKHLRTREEFMFPVLRWIKARYHYIIHHLDTSLPQHDDYHKQRGMELEEKKCAYEYGCFKPGMPAQIKNMPDDEEFSNDDLWDIVAMKTQLIVNSKISNIVTGRWKQLENMKNIYDSVSFPLPKKFEHFRDDVYFGQQRLVGANHSLIKLCTKIPDKLTVTEEMLEPVLEGNSLQWLLDNKKIFICDLQILQDIQCKRDFTMCVPIALFMVDKKNQLRPIAIQLFQEPDPDNPIFLPTDDKNLWNLVKMWYNNADTAYHQSLTHLGFTHLLMEGLTVATHRCLSLSHPVFKLLAPHFLYLIAINTRGLKTLISEGGWVDKVMNIGANGMFKLIEKGFKEWRLDLQGSLPEELKSRGVDDTNILPGYYFRDDALLVYEAIYKYCTNYINLYYNTTEHISGDWELQNWGAELTLDKTKGGVGINGLPNNGVFHTVKDIVQVVTSIIYTCSVSHGAANFPQYEEYGYPPNYPAMMRGIPPTTKEPVKEKTILQALPYKATTLEILTVSKILSTRGTNNLGDFEVQYIYDPQAVQVVTEFRADLEKVSKTIKERNKTRAEPYEYLDPEYIPNSISI